ncbi:MAG: hypothetical protein ACQEQ0_04695 [Bacteroidota bacterium]
MLKRLFILFLGSAFFFIGCQKDELTKPAEVDFLFRMEPFETEWSDSEADDNLKNAVSKNDQDNATAPGNNPFEDGNSPASLAIGKTKMVMTGIEIEGKREQGKDVFMTRDFSPPLEISLEDDEVGDYDVSFDLPQGVYTKLEFQFHVGNENHPAFEFSGPVNGNTPGKVDFKFRYKNREKIKTRALHNKQISENIVIDKSKKTQASITIDTEYLFANITRDHLANSQASGTQQGKPNIMVDKTNNMKIYNALANRIEKSIAVVFE